MGSGEETGRFGHARLTIDWSSSTLTRIASLDSGSDSRSIARLLRRSGPGIRDSCPPGSDRASGFRQSEAVLVVGEGRLEIGSLTQRAHRNGRRAATPRPTQIRRLIVSALVTRSENPGTTAGGTPMP